jgi:hypothetical protein
MSLSTQEQRALQSIDEDLSGSAPKLVSLLATFTRLARDEEMPGHERIGTSGQPRGPRSPRPGRYRCHAWRARMLSRPPTLQRAGLLLWLVITICLVAVALTVNRNGASARTCMNPWLVACGAPAPTHTPRKPGGQPASALPGAQARAGQIANGLGHG